MKINKSTKLVALALAIALLAGCGGSGGAQNSSAFPKGMYVSTYDGSSVKYFTNINGANEKEETTNAYTYCQAFDKLGRLYIGTNNGQIIMVPSPGSPNRQVFGTFGSGVNQFSTITKIAFDSVGRIYVADFSNRRIVRIDDLTGTNWTVLDMIPWANNPTDAPSSIAVDSADTMYITMKSSNRLFRFGSMTDPLPASMGSTGTGTYQFQGLNDVYVSPNLTIYLADIGNSRIVRMGNIGGDGWTTFGSPGTGAGQLDQPFAVTTDSSGHIFIADAGNYRVCRIDDMAGAGWTTFGSHGIGAGQFRGVVDVSVHE